MTTVPDIRELACAALIAKFTAALSTVTEIVSVKRKFETIDQVPAAERPAIRWLENRETGDRRAMVPPGGSRTVTLDILVLVYWNAPQGTDDAPATFMNKLLAAVDTIMRPDDMLSSRLTLGLTPRVQDCWIEGETIKDSGDLDGSGLLAVPVKVLLLP